MNLLKKLLCKVFGHNREKQNWWSYDDNGNLVKIFSIKEPWCKRCRTRIYEIT